MNQVVKEIQDSYRLLREESNFSILDIGEKLKELANEGLIWTIKEMKDISEHELVLTKHYLKHNFEKQIYDNLENAPQTNSTLKDLNMNSNLTFQKHNIPTGGDRIKAKEPLLEIKDVKQFRGYKIARELEEKVYEVCKHYPSYEKDHLVDQLVRSAESVKKSIVIAEQHFIREKFNHYSIAIGSCKEVSTWLDISFRQKYISQEKFEELNKLTHYVVGILTKTLFNIKANEGKGMNLPSPYTPDPKNFDVYNDSLLLIERIYEMTRIREFWKEKNLVFGLRNMSGSAAANLSESNQLYVPRKFKFLNNALEALGSLQSYLQSALSKQVITEETFADIEEKAISIERRIKRIMKNLSDQKMD
ncbi:four helix bundle protein [Niallia circulans]|uniref:four helix bundle protein n=1 Tax=Niallia circulans TaxID=1397 RepID=UPI001F1B6B5C|nr:four helix bundle protein [Niallia circulans]MCF2649680.1 four helix bundle protein [Niallia circulans]